MRWARCARRVGVGQTSLGRLTMIQDKFSQLTSGAVCAFIGAALAATPAAAQDSAPPEDAVQPDQQTADAGSEDESIIVTAQRRSQREQDVPISMTALTGEELGNQGITSTHDLAQSVTGITFTESGGYVQPFIRGVGSTVTNIGEPGSAATYIDGVYMPTVNGQLYELANVESIQVLRGPQGTLFGRNATSGAILITTRQPQYEPAMTLELSYANYEYWQVSGWATTGVTEGVAVAFAGNWSSHDGWFINRNPANGFGLGDRVGDADRYSLRGQLLLEPTSNLRITLAADLMHNYDASPIIIQPINGYQGFVPGGLLPQTPYDYIGNENLNYETGQTGVSGRINWDLGAVQIDSTTAYRTYESRSYYYDSDTTPVRFVAINNNDVGDNFTQEVLLSSAPSSRLNWLIGGFYLRQDANLEPLRLFLGPATVNIDVSQITEAYAGFADATVRLGDFELTGGIRYSHETKTINGSQNGVVRLNNVSETWEAWTPRAVIAYHPNDDLLIYGSYSAGFKSGAFNANALSPTPIDPENVDAFEVGFKVSPADRLRIDGAAFYYTTKDLQVQALSPLTNTIQLINAAEVESWGVDLEIDYTPISDLHLRLGASYLHAEFSNFPNAQVFLPVPNSDGRNAPAVVDVTGRRNVRSPDWTFNAAADYTIRLPDGGSIVPAGNIYYSSRFYWTVDNRISEPSHVVVNASLTWNLPGEQVYVQLWARNLFDEVRFRNVSAAVQADRRAADEPGLYGVRVGFRL